MVVVIGKDTSQEDLNRFYDLVNATVDSAKAGSKDEAPLVAFDLEGINLSRVGTVELVSLAFANCLDGEESVFLVDISTINQKGRDDRIAPVKKILEASGVEKVVHDCRMDCDALVHLHGIQVQNIHDTSIYHELIALSADVNLNEVLSYYGMEENEARDKSIYNRNPKFWSNRPLTPAMIDWASSDVDKLILLAQCQKEKISNSKLKEAAEKSKENAISVSSMNLERGLGLRGVSPGSFIGRRGSNVRSLQRRTGTMIYKDFGDSRSNVWMVFYPSQSALASVKRAMGHG